MVWTYGGDPENDPVDAVRVLSGDTDSNDPLIDDEVIAYALAQNSDNEYLAAADVCEMLSSRFARSVNLSVEGLSAQFARRSQAYAERAEQLRRMAAHHSRLGKLRLPSEFTERKPVFDIGMHDTDRATEAETRGN